MKAHYSIRPQHYLLFTLIVASLLRTTDALATSRFNNPIVTLHNLGAPHLTVQTTEGTERFVLEREDSDGNHASYVGQSRPRSYENAPTLASLSITEDKAILFTSSRRTGRPIAIRFFITRDGTVDQTRGARVHRVPTTSLACGSSAAELEATPLKLSAHRHRAGRSRRKDAPITSKAGLTPIREIEIATEADYDFYLTRRSDTNSYIRSILSATDALYTRELGLRLKVVHQKVAKKGRPDTAPIAAEQLLLEFSQSDSGTPRVDLRHLFTGRALQGSTIGIAYISTTCAMQGRYAVGLSRSVNPALQPFLAAHEIAHNLSAVHDGEPNSVMNPAITSANNRFSEKSKTAIEQFVKVSGSCLAPQALSDATLIVDPSDPTVFNAAVTFQSATQQSCSVSLYGSADGRRFSKVATRRITASGGGSTKASFIGEMPPLRSSRIFSFKAKVSCSSGKEGSNIEKLAVGAATTTTSTMSGSWLALLRSSLS